MGDITLSIPDELLLALKLTPEQLAHDLRLAAAAKLAGIPRVVFLTKLADYGVETFRLTREELERETPLA
jgi:hypothetical protein